MARTKKATAYKFDTKIADLREQLDALDEHMLLGGEARGTLRVTAARMKMVRLKLINPDTWDLTQLGHRMRIFLREYDGACAVIDQLRSASPSGALRRLIDLDIHGPTTLWDLTNRQAGKLMDLALITFDQNTSPQTYSTTRLCEMVRAFTHHFGL